MPRGSTADIGSSSIVANGPKLVILGTQSADNAVTEALGIRKLWADSKIILLFEFASPADFQKLLTSEIDGCVPLIVSPDTLISTLDLIMTKDVRVMVVSDTKRLSIPPPTANAFRRWPWRPKCDWRYPELLHSRRPLPAVMRTAPHPACLGITP